jgi:hypothetical protein
VEDLPTVRLATVHPFWGLLLAIWGLFLAIIAAFNPRKWGDALYQISKNSSKIGRVRFGLFAFSDDPTLFRFSIGFIGLFLVVIGTLIFIG